MENEPDVYKKTDGFPDEQYFIIPTQSFTIYAEHPLIRALYLTDVGYFPRAVHHFREREEGIEEHILLYCIDGAGTLEVEKTTFQIQKNQVISIPPGKKHRYYADANNPWSIFWVHFKGENTVYYPLDTPVLISIESRHAQNRLAFLFDLLFRVLGRNYTLGNFIYTSQVLSLILSEVYFREKVDEASKKNKHLTAMIRYMYKNIQQNISLESLADEFNLSKSYINAVFKAYTEHAPIDFFIDLKMQEACKLLKSTDLLVRQVAYQLGYEDPYYFSRLFKKYVGLSPKDYKNAECIQIDKRFPKKPSL